MKDYLEFNLAEVTAFSKDKTCAAVLFGELERLRGLADRLKRSNEKVIFDYNRLVRDLKAAECDLANSERRAAEHADDLAR